MVRFFGLFISELSLLGNASDKKSCLFWGAQNDCRQETSLPVGERKLEWQTGQFPLSSPSNFATLARVNREKQPVATPVYLPASGWPVESYVRAGSPTSGFWKARIPLSRLLPEVCSNPAAMTVVSSLSI
jgi:hypothetical protein